MDPKEIVTHLLLGLCLFFSSMGVVLLKNPVHASLSFLVTLMTTAYFFLELSAEFLAVTQILVYAGAILVIFIFALVLFQDVYKEISLQKSKLPPLLIAFSFFPLCFAFIHFYNQLKGIDALAIPQKQLPKDFGLVEGIGKALYTEYFFPFEAVVLLFLIALVGSVYLAKREN